MASSAAFIDANTWIGRLTSWTKDCVEAPFDISQNVFGATTVQKLSLGEQVIVTKVEAPLPANE